MKSKAKKLGIKPTIELEIEEHEALIHEFKSLRKELHTYNSWSQRLLLAVITGFGTVMGATVVVALIVYILTQLASIEMLKPFVENIVNIVEKSRL